MKNITLYSLIFIFSLGTWTISAQALPDEATGMLGDNFSLEGALDVFKNASSLEEFEKYLNTEEKSINNLDLNEDGEIDYIRVEDHMEGDVHAIVLQAVVSEDESQDIAVIEIERTDTETATLQIVGDEYLYGEDVFVEPFSEVAQSEGKGPAPDYTLTRIVVNVWAWPSVRYVYRPNYVVYRSPFRWGAYPRVWRPWRPVTWNVFHGNQRHFHARYRRVNTHRIVRARTIYTPQRRSSPRVVKRSKTVTRVRTNANGRKVVTRNTKTTKVRKNKTGNVTKTKTRKVKRKRSGN